MTAYNGAFDGVEILHGLTVAIHGMQGAPEPERTTPAFPSPQAPQPQESEIEPVIQRAIEVIGDREGAMRWLGTPVRALDYATPVSCLDDPANRKRVLSVLTQLEYGVL